jgi:hypothetical protein
MALIARSYLVPMRQQTEMDNCSDAPSEKKKHNKNIEELSFEIEIDQSRSRMGSRQTI